MTMAAWLTRCYHSSILLSFLVTRHVKLRYAYWMYIHWVPNVCPTYTHQAFARRTPPFSERPTPPPGKFRRLQNPRFSPPGTRPRANTTLPIPRLAIRARQSAVRRRCTGLFRHDIPCPHQTASTRVSVSRGRSPTMPTATLHHDQAQILSRSCFRNFRSNT